MEGRHAGSGPPLKAMPTAAAVDAALERFAGLDEKELAQPWRFRDKPMDVRYAMIAPCSVNASGRYLMC